MDDYPQCEELAEFELYEAEAEYWEEYDRLKMLKIEVSKNNKL